MDYLIAYHLREHFRYIGNQNPFLNCIDVKDLTFLVSLKRQYPTNYFVGVTSPEDNKTLIQILEKTINLKAISFTWFSYPMDPYLLANLTSAGLKHLAPLTGVFYDLRQEQTQPALSPHLKLSIAKDVTHFKDFVFIFEQT